MFGKIISALLFVVQFFTGHHLSNPVQKTQSPVTITTTTTTTTTTGTPFIIKVEDIKVNLPQFIIKIEDIKSELPQITTESNVNLEPRYVYKYNIGDHKTGDYKSQIEIRNGDVIKGEYSVRGSDGIVRRTEYTVDKNSGYKAVVTHIKPEEMSMNEIDTSKER